MNRSGDRTAPHASPAPSSSASPGQLLATVPRLLGFQPADSLVVLGLTREPGNDHEDIRLTLRYDLPGPQEQDTARDLAGHACEVLDSNQIHRMIVIGYGPEPAVAAVTSILLTQSRASGTDVAMVLRTEAGRYWLTHGPGADSNPPAGHPCDPAAEPVPGTGPAGGRVLASRDALAAQVAPVTGEAAGSMRSATRRARQRITQITDSAGPGRAARKALAEQGIAAMTEAIDTARTGTLDLTDDQAAWLAVTLRDLRVRDDAWARMDPEHKNAHRKFLADLTRRAQPAYVAAPASLLAFVAWQSGNGALANVALDRALADQPGYSMALLLKNAISAGLPPSAAVLPMTPEEVAASYDQADDEDSEPETAPSRQAAPTVAVPA